MVQSPLFPPRQLPLDTIPVIARADLASPTAADIPWRAELDAIAAAAPRASVVHQLTREQPANWLLPSGHFDATRISEIVETHRPSDPVYYVSGPPRMVESLLTLLERAGVSRPAIRVESFRSAASYDEFDDMKVTSL